MKQVGVLGAGGHARTVINLLRLNGFNPVAVYDNNFKSSDKAEFIDEVQLMGNFQDVPKDLALCIAKGSPTEIKQLQHLFLDQLLKENLLHPKAVLESSAMGYSNQFSALCYLAKTAKIGNNNIVYSGSSIEHEVEIGNSNVITVNVALCGRSKIGNGCFLGASSTLLPGISICDNVTVGAGSVVTKHITEAGTYVGIPAKKLLR